MSSHKTPVAAHRKPVLFAIVWLAGERTGHGGQTLAAAPCADGPAGSKGAANCAAGEMKKAAHGWKAALYRSKVRDNKNSFLLW
ncbi:hypothetical protein [Propionispora sp. 2/2-37]|uniref:hypothetical protein n=1 Tax=Propionispora sp. 2/2-37 TaxID=1677858 RepID=UPI0006BB6EB4|nr:hypothetical protein [Propionispora sp. 2/2-37]